MYAIPPKVVEALTVRLVKVPAAGVILPIVMPSILPPVSVEEEDRKSLAVVAPLTVTTCPERPMVTDVAVELPIVIAAATPVSIAKELDPKIDETFNRLRLESIIVVLAICNPPRVILILLPSSKRCEISIWEAPRYLGIKLVAPEPPIAPPVGTKSVYDPPFWETLNLLVSRSK